MAWPNLSNVTGDYMILPQSVQEIAAVIGRDAALYLIGQLPVCYVADKGKGRRGDKPCRKRIIMYVPKRLKPDHRLVQILGWNRAEMLVRGFGGEILCPANCEEVYLRFRNNEIRRLRSEGMGAKALAEIMGVGERLIIELTREIPQEEMKPANDNRARD